MNLETKITIYKFTPQVFTLTRKKQLPPAKKKSAYCPILFGLLIMERGAIQHRVLLLLSLIHI